MQTAIRYYKIKTIRTIQWIDISTM